MRGLAELDSLKAELNALDARATFWRDVAGEAFERRLERLPPRWVFAWLRMSPDGLGGTWRCALRNVETDSKVFGASNSPGGALLSAARKAEAEAETEVAGKGRGG